MNYYFEKNLQALKRHSKKALEILITINEVKSVEVFEAKDGTLTLRVIRDGQTWNMNSRLSPDYAAELFVQRYEIKDYKVFVSFGFADGRIIRNFIQRFNKTNELLVCIPDIEEFYVLCNKLDISDILEDERVRVYFPQVDKNLEGILDATVGYANMNLLEFCILPGQDVLHTQVCRTFIDKVIQQLQKEIVNKSTRMGFGRMVSQHMLYHMKNVLYQSDLEQLKRRLQTYNIDKIPVIIVSAGPSLDKNVHVLKQAEGKAFIMVVDAAVRTVVRAGIRPDIVCTIDPESPDKFFEKMDLRELCWLCGRLTRPEVLKRYGGNVIYQGNFTAGWMREIEKELEYVYPSLKTGGSVTSDAFVAAEYLGFKNIILIGQDMAFTGGVSHTEGIEGAFGDNDEYIQSRMRVTVEGIHGEMLETDFQMFSYKKWFEQYIELYCAEMDIIDATEGGAKIEGTRIMDLQDALNIKCHNELDIYSIIKNVPPTFNEEQRKRLLKKLNGIDNEVLEVQTKIKELIKIQEEILGWLQNESVESKVWMHKLQDAMERMSEIEQNWLIDLLIFYVQEEEYAVGDTVYTEELDVKQIVEKSLGLCKGYEAATELLLEDIGIYMAS